MKGGKINQTGYAGWNGVEREQNTGPRGKEALSEERGRDNEVSP